MTNLLFLFQTLTPNMQPTPTPADWHNLTNYFSFHVDWWISLLLLVAWFAVSYPDIKYSSQFKNVGYTEGNPFGFWNSDLGFFETKPNIIATVAIGVAFFVIALMWFSPMMLAVIPFGAVRLIYAYTKLKKDIDFRKKKQSAFLTLLRGITDSSDGGLATFFSSHYQSFDWGTEGDKIFEHGGHWTYKLFPFLFSTQSDPTLAQTELRRSLYNLSQKPETAWLPG